MEGVIAVGFMDVIKSVVMAGQVRNTADPLDRSLMPLSKRGDMWTLRDACEGCQVFGQTGSGKTSGSGYHIAQAFLREGMGGLVLTAKNDEREMWESWCRAAGRGDDVVVFSPTSGHRFNFLDYEMNREGAGGGMTLGLPMLFQEVIEVASKGERHRGGQQEFWDKSAKRLIVSACDILTHAGEPITLDRLYKVVSSAPISIEQTQDPNWINSGAFVTECLVKASERSLSVSHRADVDMAGHYWMQDYPGLAAETRSGVVATFLAMATDFMHSPFRELFCTETTITPEVCLEGKIIIVDLPVLEYKEIGQQAQVIWKYLWQRAVERRSIGPTPSPVFLWADEAQYFITSNDTKFQSTSRSKQVCTVYLTQSLPSYLAELGGEKARPAVDSLLGNLGTKIFHMNLNPETNMFAANLIGKTWQYRRNHSVTEQAGNGGLADVWAPKISVSSGASESEEYEVQPVAFSDLKTGGPNNKYIVEAVVSKGGRRFRASGKNYLFTQFTQPGNG